MAAVTASRLARAHGFSQTAAQEIAIVVSELATNQLRHASGGRIEVRQTPGVFEIVALDRGPGLADPTQTLEAIAGAPVPPPPPPITDIPFEPRDSLGYGLGSVLRLSDQLELENRPEGGLRVRAVKRLPSSPQRRR